MKLNSLKTIIEEASNDCLEFHQIENVFFSYFCVRGKFILNRVSLLGGVNLENEGVKVVKRGVPVLVPFLESID